MRLFRAVCLAAALKSLVTAYIGFTYGDCAPNTVASAANVRYSVGDTATLCVHFNGNVSAAFTPKVDQYDAISFAGSNYALPGGTGYIEQGVGPLSSFEQPTTWNTNCSSGYDTTTLYITFDVSMLNVATPVPRIYKKIEINPCLYGNGSVIYTIPIYTVIIGLDNGAVEYISFDDGCFFCAANGASCVPNALDLNGTQAITDNADLVGCRQESSVCYPSSSDASNSTVNDTATSNLPQSLCDLKLFVVWTGTDASGNYLTSAGRRFSRFRQYGTASAYQSGLNLLSDAENLAQNAIDAAKGIPGRVMPNRELRAGGVGLAMESDAAGMPAIAGYSAPQPLPRV